MSEYQQTEPVRTPLPKWLLPLATGVAGVVVGASAVLIVGAIVAAVGTVGSNAASGPDLSAILRACSIPDNQDALIGDNGTTLTINSQGNNDPTGLSIGDGACLLKQFNAPQSVVSHIDQTTSMDGRQTETWGKVTFSWSYHPDRGLDGVFKIG